MFATIDGVGNEFLIVHFTHIFAFRPFHDEDAPREEMSDAWTLGVEVSQMVTGADLAGSLWGFWPILDNLDGMRKFRWCQWRMSALGLSREESKK